MGVTAADERPHAPGPELRWSESWTFDFVSDDGQLGGWARLALLPNLGTAWYHGFLVGAGRQIVAVIDTDVPMPDRSLEIRTTGLWATHICETPLEHWTIGLEAFAVGVEDPAELYGRQHGDQVPLGFDLEWEATAPADDAADAIETYRQPCRVSGEVLVGAEQLDLDGNGTRSHRWGALDLWDSRWFRIHGWLEDGTSVSACVVDGDLASATGSVGGRAVDVVAAGHRMAGPGIPSSANVTIGSIALDLEPMAITAHELTDSEQRRTRAPRALVRLVAADGRTGSGWAEWNEPQP
jgi:hypothetical protein